MIKTWYDRGEEAGFAKGYEKGFDKGVETGLEKGIEKGYEKGIAKGVRKTVLCLIARRFGPSAQAKAEKITAEMSEDQLQELADVLIDPSQTLSGLGLAEGERS